MQTTIHRRAPASQAIAPGSRRPLDHATSNIRFNILKDPAVVTPSPHSLLDYHFSRPVRSYKDAVFLRSVVSTYLDPAMSCEPLEAGLRSRVCEALDHLIESNTGHRMVSKEDLQEDTNIPQERFKVLAGDPADLERAISAIEATDWRLLETEDFTRMVTSNKAQSVALQLHIASLDDISDPLLDLAIRSVDVLCGDKFGCYLVCKLIGKSQRLKSVAEQHARQSLVKLASSQHGSRVLQTLCRTDQAFRHFCLSQLNHNWHILTSHISAIFLLSVCLEHTPNNHSCYLDIGRSLARKSERTLNSKPYKRVLVM